MTKLILLLALTASAAHAGTWRFLKAAAAASGPPTSGLTLWLDGNDTAQMNGGSITTGTGVSALISKDTGALTYSQATSGKRPVYTANILNSKGVLRFTHASDMHMTGPAGQLFSTGSAMQLIFVAYCTDNSTQPIIMNLKGATNQTSMQLGYFTGGYADFFWGSNSVGPLRAQTITQLNTWNASQITYNGSGATTTGNWTAKNNGSTLTVSSSAAQATNAANVLGDWAANGGQGWSGDIAAILMYDHILSAGDQTQLNTYINTQFGL